MKNLKKKVFRWSIVLGLMLSLTGCTDEPPVAKLDGVTVKEVEVKPVEVKEITIKENILHENILEETILYEDVTTYWD